MASRKGDRKEAARSTRERSRDGVDVVELAELERRNYQELRNLLLPIEREPTFVFRVLGP